MKNILLLLSVAILLIGAKSSFAQLETRIATNCAVESVQVPINIKDLENIKSFQLKILFNNDLLQFDTSLYHHSGFALNNDENYQIHVEASHDTMSIWWSAVYGVNVADELLLSLVFLEIGSGEAVFTWIEEECFYKDIYDLNISALYTVDGPMNIPFNSSVIISFEQFTIGCRDNSESGGCKAQAEANIIGGTAPYTYQWSGIGQNDSIAIGLCQDPISVVIRDAADCIYASIFDPVIYPAAVYDIEASPDVIYITTPYVDFSIETDDEYIESYLWDFGDESTANTEMVSHTYHKVGNYEISLRTENLDGCDTTVYLKNFEVKELNFCIPNVITPNGDTYNDTWIFKIIGEDGGGGSSSDTFKYTGYSDVDKCSGEDLIFDEQFKSTYLVILNRNGNTVYDCTNCTEYWDGGNLPDGVYYYVFTWEGEYSNGKEQGNVTILGGLK